MWLCSFSNIEREHAYFFFIHLMQVSLRKDCLDIKEQDYYESLYNESQAQFNTYVTCFFLFSFPYNEIIVKHIVLHRKYAIGRYQVIHERKINPAYS